jgi:hypothetical protein
MLITCEKKGDGCLFSVNTNFSIYYKTYSYRAISNCFTYFWDYLARRLFLYSYHANWLVGIYVLNWIAVGAPEIVGSLGNDGTKVPIRKNPQH